MAVGICALCKQTKNLENSHIIPNFIGKKLKKTSATGFLRDIVNPEKRKQDLVKMPLLCRDCEELFSKLETYFANQFYNPFFDKDITKFEYDERLKKFVVSLSWRTLIVSYDDFILYNPFLKKPIDDVEESWRNYLLGNNQHLNEECHMVFLDYIDDPTDEIPAGYQWYTLRGCDASLVGNNFSVLSYTKIPWMYFVTSIIPKELNGWIGTKIIDHGEISLKQEIIDEKFREFFVDRAGMALKELGNADYDKIIKKMNDDPERFFNSQSFEVMLSEAKRKRKEKKKNLPENIVSLIEIIENGIENPALGELNQKQIKWFQRAIADSLSQLPNTEAQKINNDIDHSIKNAKMLKKNTCFLMDSNSFLSYFLVDLSKKKQEQKTNMEKKLSHLKSIRKPEDDRRLVIFSFNPYLELPYETLYYLE